jgi:cellulose biosynthesis protein BcsQ
MSDLFHFLKELLRTEPEVIAAFIMGVIVAAVFLSSLLYWFFSRYYSRKVKETAADLDQLRAKLKDAKDEVAEAQKKHEREARESAEQQNAWKRQTVEKVRAAKEMAQQREADLKKQLEAWNHKYKKLYAKAVKELKPRIQRLEAVDAQARQVEELQGKFWEAPVRVEVPAFRPLTSRRARIIAVTNLKGGVGKTTLTANLAATYAAKGKQVLVVDLDFQASLTGCCLGPDGMLALKQDGGKWIDNVFKADADPVRAALSSLTRVNENGMHLLAASENLFDVEEQTKARWLMNLAGPDIRCILRAALHDPSFADRFDIILLDCPPRWTPASINALTSCDYVLIPVLLDRLSAEAVPRLLQWLHNLKSIKVYQEMNVLGVVANRANPRAILTKKEQAIWEALPRRCASAWKHPVHHFVEVIRNKSEFADAAERHEFAASSSPVKEMFVALVDEMEGQRARHESR